LFTIDEKAFFDYIEKNMSYEDTSEFKTKAVIELAKKLKINPSLNYADIMKECDKCINKNRYAFNAYELKARLHESRKHYEEAYLNYKRADHFKRRIFGSQNVLMQKEFTNRLFSIRREPQQIISNGNNRFAYERQNSIDNRFEHNETEIKQLIEISSSPLDIKKDMNIIEKNLKLVEFYETICKRLCQYMSYPMMEANENIELDVDNFITNGIVFGSANVMLPLPVIGPLLQKYTETGVQVWNYREKVKLRNFGNKLWDTFILGSAPSVIAEHIARKVTCYHKNNIINNKSTASDMGDIVACALKDTMFLAINKNTISPKKLPDYVINESQKFSLVEMTKPTVINSIKKLCEKGNKLHDKIVLKPWKIFSPIRHAFKNVKQYVRGY
jgi:hypothetical protein